MRSVGPDRQPPGAGRRRDGAELVDDDLPLAGADVVPVLGRPADHHDVLERIPTRPFSHRMTPTSRSVTDVGYSQQRPLHIGCIMDGNGRWAARRGMPRTAGHTEGEENLARLVRVAVRRNIGWLTVFGFSTENWMRPPSEVRHILGLHKKLFGRIAELNELNVRVQWIGRPFDSPAARTPEVGPAGDPQGDRRHQRATPECCSPSPSTTAHGWSCSTPSTAFVPRERR